MKTHRIDKHIANLRFALLQKKGDRDQRPNFGRIYFKEGNVYACDTYIMYKGSTEIFTDCPDLNGKSLTFDALVTIGKMKDPHINYETLEVFDNGDKFSQGGIWTKLLPFDEIPPFEEVIPHKTSRQSVEVFGIVPDKLARLGKCFRTDFGVRLDFNGENRAAIVTPINGELGEMGIIMPIKVL